MNKFREFQAELERLHQQAESARRKEKGEALARIRALIVEYELTPDDFGFAATRARPVSSAPPKYRNPTTGATWTGRGRPPRWLDGKDRAQFAI